MVKKTINILMIEDDEDYSKMVMSTISDVKNVSFDIKSVGNLDSGLTEISGGGYDVVLLDLGLPDSKGLDSFRKVRDSSNGIPIVVLTGMSDEEAAIEAVKEGAQDYLFKSETRPELLSRILIYSMDRKRLENELIEAKEGLEFRVREQTEELEKELSERLKIEETLLNSEAKYRLLVESASVGIAIGQDEMFKFFNPAFSEILGYSDEELKSKPFTELLHPDDKERASEIHHKRVKGEEVPLLVEYRVIDGKGNLKWLEVNGVSTTWEGRPAALNFITDITERKRAEEALRESEEKYRILFESSPVGIGVAGIEGKIFAFNSVMKEMLGYSDEELENVDPEDTYANRDDRKELLRLLKKSGSVKEFETNLKRKDGKIFIALLNAHLLELEEQKLILTVARDITDIKAAEDALKESEERYRSLVEDINDVIFNLDIDGKFTYISPVIEKISAYSTEDITGKSFEQFVYPEDISDVQEVFNDRESHASKTTEFRAFDKDGQIHHMLVSSRTKLEGGNYAGITGVITDITERKKVEDRLREMNDIVNRSPVVAFLWRNDEDWSVEFVSENVKELFGYTAESFIKGEVKYAELIHPEDIERVGGEVARFSNSEGTELFSHMPYRIITKEGQTKWVDDRTRIITDKGGEITHYEGIVLDITDRKRAENELRESEEKWRNLFENSIEAVFTVDLKGNFTDMNSALASIMDYEKEEIIGSNYKRFTTPEKANEVFKVYNHLYRTGEPIRDFAYETIRKDGEVRTVEVHVNTIRKGDEIVGFQGTLRDITERKRAEEALQDSEEKFRTLIERASDAISIVDKDGIMQYVSPSNDRVQGDKPEDIIGTNYVDIIHPDDLEGMVGVFSDLLNKKSDSITATYRCRHKDGSWRIMEATSREFLDDPKIRGIVTNYRDITERKKAEDHIVNLNRLLKSIRDINQLIFRVKDSNALLQEACDTLTRVGGYCMAWMALVEEDNKKIVPVAQSGFENHFFKDLSINWDDLISGAGSTVTAVKTMKPSVFNDTVNDPEFELWSEEAKKMGYRSSASIPLVYNDRVYGVLRVYCDDEEKFDNEEIKLLDEVSQDLAFALYTLEAEEERRKTVEDLRKSEERYRNLVENLNDVVFNLDMDGVVTYISPKVENESEFNMDEIIGQPFINFVHPEDQAMMEEIFSQRFYDFEKSFEFRTNNKSGQVQHLHISSRVQLEDGKPIGITGILTNITSQKIAEEKLKKEQEKAQQYLDIVEVMLVALNNDGEITLINRKGSAILGYKDGELIGKNWIATCSPEESQGEVSELFRKLRDGEVESTEYFEFPILTKKGERRIVSWHSTILKDEGGDVIGILGSGEDITVRKLSEEAIKESEKKFHGLFDTSRDVVFIADIDGNFEDISKSGEKLFGHRRGELLSIGIKDLCKKTVSGEKLLKTIYKNGFVEDYEVAMADMDENQINSLISASVREDGDGKAIGYQGVIRDITIKKKMEEKLVQTEKLSSLGGILSGVAHELNNPLTSIIGNAQLLARKNIPGEIKDKLEIIQKESVRCTKIVGGLLAFAREHKPERNMISINEVLNESFKLREYELKTDNVDFSLELSDDIPQTFADPFQLHQVFINLINNAHDALKSTGGGGLVIRTFNKDKKIVIEFEDDGPGIPSEKVNKIFDPFFTTKEVGEGTGLGLSIVYGIINEHDGEIRVETERGRGTKFIIELPVVMGTELKEERRVREKIEKPGGIKTVLIVEDEESLRDYVHEALKEEGYVAKVCGSVEEAIRMMEQENFDVVVSDIKMPGLGGQNLYTYIQKHHPHLIEKILFITGDVLGKETQSFFKITGVEYLEKPFDIDVFLKRIYGMVSYVN